MTKIIYRVDDDNMSLVRTWDGNYRIRDDANNFYIEFKSLQYLEIIKRKIKYALEHHLYMDTRAFQLDTKPLFHRDKNIITSNFFREDRYNALEKFIQFLKAPTDVNIKKLGPQSLLFYLVIRREVVRWML